MYPMPQLQNGARRGSACALLLLLVSCQNRAGLPTEGGVVVEEVVPGFAAQRAGLAPGDFLVSWQREGTDAPGNQNRFSSPMDLLVVERCEAAQGAVTISTLRDGRVLEATLPPGEWRVEVRPVLGPDALARYQAGKRLLAAGEIDAGLRRWRHGAEGERLRGERLNAVWWWLKAAAVLLRAGRAEDAQELHAKAKAEAAPDSALAAWTWERIGDSLVQGQRHREAVVAYQASRELQPPSHLIHLAVQAKLSVAKFQLGHFDEAEVLLQDTLRRRRQLVVDDAATAALLVRGAMIERNRGNLDRATALLEEAVGISRRLDPDGRTLAGALNELGIVADRRGDQEEAQRRYQEAMDLYARLGVEDEAVGMVRMGFGVVAWNRRDLATAQRQFSAALDVFQSQGPSSLLVAWALQNLGLVMQDRGKLDDAEDFLRRSLEIRQAISAHSLDVAYALNNLATVVRARGDHEAARRLLKRAHEIARASVPGSLFEAYILGNLGNLAADADDLGEALSLYRENLALVERLAPGGLDEAAIQFHLGDIALRKRQMARAEEHHTEALRIRRLLAPRTVVEAESLHALAELYAEQGRSHRARDFYLEAIAAVEAHHATLGSSSDLLTLRAQYMGFYRHALAWLVEGGEEALAFHVLERSRARALLAMLAERELLGSAELAPELARERRRVALEYDRVQDLLANLSPTTAPDQVRRSLAQLRHLRRRQDRIQEQIRQSSPRLAALQYPTPLDAEAARRGLDPGTVLLSYSVGEEVTYLFQLPWDGRLEVTTLAVGEDELRQKVERLRLAVEAAGSGGRGSGVLSLGKDLYRALIEPAFAQVSRAQRLLIVPDGPLHLLPFAALVMPQGAAGGAADGDRRYLVEWKPLHLTVSMTVYDELRQARRTYRSHPGEPVLAAFGDPSYSSPKTAAGSRPPRQSTATGPTFAPLPWSRHELEAIAALYGDEAEVFLGAEATEDQVRKVGPGVRYLHFATHGFLDERFPLNSGLALTQLSTQEGEDNGLLQAWEVMERMRLGADLVSLSSCESAAGREVAGEGLLGLSRAFQFAGARSVLGSLWRVSDLSTSVLMSRFYFHLRSGMSKDEALRQTQLELIRRPVTLPQAEPPRSFGSWLSAPLGRSPAVRSFDASHPFYWAGFQLMGDWN